MIDAFVLAGGASTRMGSDKALARLGDGRRLVDVVATALAVAGPVRVVRRAGQAPVDGHEVVVDVEGPLHPLTGLATALRAARTPLVLVAPCDLPGLLPEHVRTLLAGGDVAAGAAGDDVQPLLAVLRASDADRALAAALAGGSVRAFVDGVPRVQLPVDALRNANFPADLRTVAGEGPSGSLPRPR